MKKEHIKYPKIYRYGKPEVEGILSGKVHMSEKLDGANVSIWIKGGGTFEEKLRIGSRNKEVNDFRGLRDYILGKGWFREFFENNPELRLFGEWLVPHTINYEEKHLHNFYLFDILDEKTGQYLKPSDVESLASVHGILFPKSIVLDVGDKGWDYVAREASVFMAKPNYGDMMEGVVIKNNHYVNKYGDKCHAKIINDKFEEEANKKKRPEGVNEPEYWEKYIRDKYLNVPRVRKNMNKIRDDIEGDLSVKHLCRITGCVSHDIVTEEIYGIFKKGGTVDFKLLKRILADKTKEIYLDLLNEK